MAQTKPGEKSRKERVIECLSAVTGMTAPHIAKLSGLPVTAVDTVLRYLMGPGQVRRAEALHHHGKTGFEYFLCADYVPPTRKAELPPMPAGDIVPLRIIPTEQTRHRLVLLKRMRDRLICDHHPLLTLVIADYEHALRDPTDGAEA